MLEARDVGGVYVHHADGSQLSSHAEVINTKHTTNSTSIIKAP
jgi:hypothetical protein